MARSLLTRARRPHSLDRRIGWDKLPQPLGLLTLVGLRHRLRDENLYDTGRGALDVPPIDSSTTAT